MLGNDAENDEEKTPSKEKAESNKKSQNESSSENGIDEKEMERIESEEVGVKDDEDDNQGYRIGVGVPRLKKKMKEREKDIKALVGDDVDNDDEISLEENILDPIHNIKENMKDKEGASIELRACLEVFDRCVRMMRHMRSERKNKKRLADKRLSKLERKVSKYETSKEKERELEQLHKDMRRIMDLVSASDNPFFDSESMRADIEKGSERSESAGTAQDEHPQKNSHGLQEAKDEKTRNFNPQNELEKKIAECVYYVEDELGKDFPIVLEYFKDQGWFEHEQTKQTLMTKYHEMRPNKERSAGTTKTINGDGNVTYPDLDLSRKEVQRVCGIVDEIEDIVLKEIKEYRGG